MNQQTISRPISFEGIALHSGNIVSVRLLPAAADSGIVFRRADIGADIAADCRAVCGTHLATALGGEGGAVSTVEHLLSALAALALDNITVELDGDELPILDGSAASWVVLLSACGAVAQKAARKYIRVRKEVSAAENAARASWKPAAKAESSYDITIDFPHAVVRRTAARCSFALAGGAGGAAAGDADGASATAEIYEKEIARARTFCYINDVETMHKHNRALGGSLQNAVVYDDNGVLNAEGLRYADEFVRHKMLDAIGDCYINGHLVLGAYAAHSPGHGVNNKLMRALIADESAWEFAQ